MGSDAMSGRFSRNKGARGERIVVHTLQDAGIAAERIPLSGAAGGSFAGDVVAPLFGDDRTLEVKTRATGFARLYGWLAGHAGLVIREDRREPLILMRLSDVAKWSLAYEKATKANDKAEPRE
jgi:Holliday junction resolvase